MATITIGNSVLPAGTGAHDGVAHPSAARVLTLTNGSKIFETTATCAANATTDVWTATNHGVSATAASGDIAFILIDPAQEESSSLSVDVILTYTTSGTTTTTVQPTYLVAKREMGVIAVPGTGVDSSINTRYLTKIQIRNRNTGTSDAVKVLVQVWN